MRTLVFSIFLLPGLAACSAFAEGETQAFPHHTAYTAGTIKPSAKNQAALDQPVLDFYKVWKQKYLRPAAPGQLYVFANAERTAGSRQTRSVSEGQGYGMIATALMAGPEGSGDPDAHAAFDALYHFFRAHPTDTHSDLMAWRQIAKAGSQTLTEGHDDRDSATDGDLDIAYALLLADRQWGSKGPINYKAAALKVIAAILSSETDPTRHTLTLGDWEDDESPCWGSLRTSDFIPGHLKAYAAASGDPAWTEIIKTTYHILGEITSSFSPKTGLLPDFIVLSKGHYAPAPSKFLEGSHDGAYSYNACRVPWRIGTDYLISGDPRALALLKQLNTWIQSATKGNPGRINAGYELDGRRLDKDESMAFVGPFAVAAMAEGNRQEWLDGLWKTLLARSPDAEDYYGNSVKLLTMIVASGNWW